MRERADQTKAEGQLYFKKPVWPKHVMQNASLLQLFSWRPTTNSDVSAPPPQKSLIFFLIKEKIHAQGQNSKEE